MIPVVVRDDLRSDFRRMRGAYTLRALADALSSICFVAGLWATDLPAKHAARLTEAARGAFEREVARVLGSDPLTFSGVEPPMKSDLGDSLLATPRTWRRRAAVHEAYGQRDLARLCLMAAETATAREAMQRKRTKHNTTKEQR